MWVYNGIEIRGEEPACIREDVCKFFDLDTGVLTQNQRKEEPIFFCGVGEFKMTRKKDILPRKCSMKNFIY